MRWDWTNWSNLVWGLLTVLVIAFELLGVFRVGPWRSLSETIWLDEDHVHIIYLLIGGFLCGLGLHFLSRTPFWWSMGIGLVIVVLSHILDGWPKW